MSTEDREARILELEGQLHDARETADSMLQTIGELKQALAAAKA